MKRVKIMMVLLIIVALLLIIPNMVNAETYSDTEQGIEWSYELDENDNVINLKCETKDVTGTVTIPSEIDGKTVTSLSGDWNNGVFADCTGLTEVIIPNTISTISSYAFDGCVGLKTVTIPDSVTKIDSGAFSGCSGLNNIKLPETLREIGNLAFSRCSGLKSLTIPNSVVEIGDSAFRDCSGLQEVKISESLTIIKQNTFGNCSNLTSVIIPESVTTIEDGGYFVYGAFNNCKNLSKILIPDSVVSIDEDVFYGCDKLTIYGNDGAVSKEYAEQHEIPFDYIANWDKSDSGSDITAPTVESIEVTTASIGGYDRDPNNNSYMVPADGKIVVNVKFNEKVKGTEVPKLTIKFGTGNNIELTEGTISDSVITYSYTVKNSDKGLMTTVELSGGNITDEVGNVATLSCPELKVQNDDNASVYANGTAINIDNPNTGNDNNNNNGNQNNNNTNNNSNNVGKDDTTAPGTLPQTGVSIGISIAIISVLVIGIFTYIKYRRLKGI